MQAELEVGFLEQQKAMQMAVQSGEMIPERYELEIKKLQEQMQMQLQQAQEQMTAELQSQATIVENVILSEKEFKILKEDPNEALCINNW